MEKFAWRAKLLPNKKEEYIFRHNNIWPEMKKVLSDAGIVNYSIWIEGDDIFGYYECLKGIEYASKIQNESSVVKKWNEYMKDVMVMKVSDTQQPKLEQVFNFK